MPPLPPSVWVAGCGYVGRPLAEALFKEGVAVLGLTRAPESARTLHSQVPFPVHACDLSSPEAVRRLAESMPAPAAVVHCASSSHGGAEAYRAVYESGCANLRAALPGSPLLFTSSTSVYPQTGGETVTETSPTAPLGETGQILRAAEDLVLHCGGIVARLSGIYGPGRSIHLQRVLDGSATLEPEPSRYLNQIHRDDIVSALLLLLSHREGCAGQVFNVSDGDSLTQRSCCEALAAHFELPLPPETPLAPDRKRGWTHKRVDSSKLRALGWSPRYPRFLEAIERDPELLPSIRRKIAGIR